MDKQAKKKRHFYSKEDDKIIVKYIQKYSFNITLACRKAAEKIGTSPGSVQFRYYTVIAKNKSINFCLISNSNVTSNYKNKKGTPIKSSKFKEILKIILGV